MVRIIRKMERRLNAKEIAEKEAAAAKKKAEEIFATVNADTDFSALQPLGSNLH